MKLALHNAPVDLDQPDFKNAIITLGRICRSSASLQSTSFKICSPLTSLGETLAHLSGHDKITAWDALQTLHLFFSQNRPCKNQILLNLAPRPFQQINVCFNGYQFCLYDNEPHDNINLLARWMPEIAQMNGTKPKIWHVEFPQEEGFLISAQTSRQARLWGSFLMGLRTQTPIPTLFEKSTSIP